MEIVALREVGPYSSPITLYIIIMDIIHVIFGMIHCQKDSLTCGRWIINTPVPLPVPHTLGLLETCLPCSFTHTLPGKLLPYPRNRKPLILGKQQEFQAY